MPQNQSFVTDRRLASGCFARFELPLTQLRNHVSFWKVVCASVVRTLKHLFAQEGVTVRNRVRVLRRFDSWHSLRILFDRAAKSHGLATEEVRVSVSYYDNYCLSRKQRVHSASTGNLRVSFERRGVRQESVLSQVSSQHRCCACYLTKSNEIRYPLHQKNRNALQRFVT